MKKIKTTICFNPPPQKAPAYYGYRLIINGKEQPDDVRVAADATSFDVTSEQGTQLVILFAACDEHGHWSPATVMEFVVQDHVPPMRPTDLRVLDVAEPTATDNANRVAIALSKQLTDDQSVYNMTVTGHAEIKDGAVGTIIGVDPQVRDVIHAIFPAAALKPGVKNDGRSKEYTFGVGDKLDIMVISPSQEPISLQDYLRIQADTLNAATDNALADVT